MNDALSPNTQAILLLTAPLILGRKSEQAPTLTASQYASLARLLHGMGKEPADLLREGAEALIDKCRSVLGVERAQALLGRGFLLSQALEGWRARAIWVVSRADEAYPKRLKVRLRGAAPPVLYGCGDPTLLDAGGLAVVGSRKISDDILSYCESVGRLAAEAGVVIVSGGAKGVDQAAMGGALNAGGRAVGMLANNLDRSAIARENRRPIMDGRLVLVSATDPKAGFNVGMAMQRNKFIYALSDGGLVANSDEGKGGTWSGATEQLEKRRLVQVYVRASGEPSAGLDALRSKGALPWPEPKDPEALVALLKQAPRFTPPEPEVETLSFDFKAPKPQKKAGDTPTQEGERVLTAKDAEADAEGEETCAAAAPKAASEMLFEAARQALLSELEQRRNEAELSQALELRPTQVRDWLTRLEREGDIKRLTRPAGFIRRRSPEAEPPPPQGGGPSPSAQKG